MSIQNNPLRHYNKTQIRKLFKRIRELRNVLAKPSNERWGLSRGICGSLGLTCSPRGPIHEFELPSPHWTLWSKYSGDPTYPIGITQAQFFKLVGAKYKDILGDDVDVPDSSMPYLSYIHSTLQQAWSTGNPYGAKRMELLGWLEAAAKEMHHHFHG